MVSVLPRIGFTRKSLLFGVILITTICNSLIFFADAEIRENYAHWIIGISAAVATSLAIFILYSQKHHDGLIEKADLALAIALSLSLGAAILWATYEIILEVVPPVPSLADVLSIAAYASLAYYVFSTYLRFYKLFHFSNKPLIAAVIASGIFLFYVISYTMSLADLSSSRGVAMFSVIVAFPVLDAIIIVPSFLIVANYRKEPQWFTPWVCKSAGIFLVAISDSWFALFVVTSLTNELWPSAMIFAAHNVIIAAGLLWYVKYLATPNDARSHTIVNQNTDSPDNIDSNIPQPGIKLQRSRKSENTKFTYLTFVAIAALSISSVILIVGTVLSSSSIRSLTEFPFFATSDTTDGLQQTSSSGNTVKLGALLPLTGVSSSSGKTTEAALKMALKDVNANFSKSNSTLRYELVVQDTESDPALSLEKLKLLAKEGIRIVIGPATSAELKAVKDYASNNDIIFISHSSTAPSLAIEGDNVFRFVPDDSHQAEAISKIMWDDGIRVVIPVWRNDVYGDELMHAVRERFQEMGGEFDKEAESLGYAPRTGQLAASLHRINFVMWDNALKLLDSNVQHALSRYDSENVGVYLVSLDEVTPIFIQAYSHPVLSKVKWYGSDGSALNEALVRNHDSALFAVNTSFSSPIYRLNNEKNEKLNHIMEEIRKEVHTDPSPYSVVAYDILWVAAIAENETRYSRDNSSQTQTIHHLKEVLLHSANLYHGVTGNTALNRMGDRNEGDYDFWQVMANIRNDETPVAWQKVYR